MHFEALVGGMTPGKALDLACGEGRHAIWLAERGWEVDGLDFSSAGVEKARTLAAQRAVTVNFQIQDVTLLTSKNCYDLVAAVYLHTSPEERDLWLPGALGAVKPGGRFLYIGHDPRNIEEGAGGPQEPAILPSADELKSKMTGFDVVTAETRRRPLTADPGHGGKGNSALDTVLLVIAP